MGDTDQRPSFCVVGAGHGGLAMSAHLSLLGFDVKLFNRTPQRLEPIRQSGTIQLLAPGLGDLPHGAARIKLATSSMKAALRGANLVMVCVPANGHAYIAEQCAPHTWWMDRSSFLTRAAQVELSSSGTYSTGWAVKLT